MGLDLNDIATIFSGASAAVEAGSQDVQTGTPGSAIGIFDALSQDVLNAWDDAAQKYNADKAAAEAAVQKVGTGAKNMAVNAWGIFQNEPYKTLGIAALAMGITLGIYYMTKGK